MFEHWMHLECADRAMAEFMLSTRGTNPQSSLAHIGALNKQSVWDGWIKQDEESYAANSVCKIQTVE